MFALFNLINIFFKLKMFEQKEKKDAAPHNFLFENHFAF